MRKATTESYCLEKLYFLQSLWANQRTVIQDLASTEFKDCHSRRDASVSWLVSIELWKYGYQNVSAAGGLAFRAWLVKQLSFIDWVVFKWVLVITLLRLLNNLSKNVNFCLLVGICHWILVSYHINLSNYFITSLLLFSFNFYFLLSKVDVLDVFSLYSLKLEAFKAINVPLMFVLTVSHSLF